MAHYDDMAQLQPLQMPQTYVGHETSLRSPQTMDWQQQQTPFHFGAHPMGQMQGMPQPQSPYGNGHQITSPIHQMYPMHPNNMQTFANTWQQGFPANMHAGRPSLDFGTDQNFMHSGYAAPDGAVDADLSVLYNAMGPASTPSTTQPNTRPPTQPNTEPSSPVVTKKRKLNNYHAESSTRMTNGTSTNGRRVTEPSPQTSTRKQRKSFVKHEQPPTPLSKTPTSHGGDDEALEEDDAEYDEEDADEDLQRSPSPSNPWPASKTRPPKIDKPPLSAKSSKARKKSTASATSTKPPRARRSSSGLMSSVTRVPLTVEQKKANHTNSEQRRRDATARAYAELYDLVPEIQEMGKQSTMKKLEVVVQKVRDVKARLEYLRGLMGQDPGSGRVISGQIIGGDMAHLQAWR